MNECTLNVLSRLIVDGNKAVLQAIEYAEDYISVMLQNEIFGYKEENA